MILNTLMTAVFVVANPPLNVDFKCSVAPQSEENAQKASGVGPVLQTPLKIFLSKKDLSLVDDLKLEKDMPALTNLVVSDSFPNTKVLVPEIADNMQNSVFVQLGGKNAFGRSAYFFGDLLLTDVNCPDYKDGVTNSRCGVKFSSIQIFDRTREVPAQSKIRVKLFRNGNLLTRNLARDLMGEDENKNSFLNKYTRNSSGQPLSSPADESPKGTLKGYFLYASYQFQGSSNPTPEKGDGTYEVKYGLEQAGYRIPVLSRQNPMNPFKKSPDSYLIEVEVTPSDKPAYTQWAIVDVGVDELIDPSKIEFKTK